MARNYDRFRDRIMFPIRDARGRCIGFGGRVMGTHDEPKYLNSPETVLFHKGRELYGLYEARQALRKIDRLVVVEGYMDVVGLAQTRHRFRRGDAWHGNNGRAPEPAVPPYRGNPVLFRRRPRRPRRRLAGARNRVAACREGRQIRFVFLPDGQDPDSYVNAERARIRSSRRIDAACRFVGVLCSRISPARLTWNPIDGRARLAELAKALLARKFLPGVYRELLTDKLADKVGLSCAKLERPDRQRPSRRRQAGGAQRPHRLRPATQGGE